MNIKTILPAVFLALFLLNGCEEQRDTKPNIVLVIIDDMGWKDFGEAGSIYYETPNIDRLAREGVRFTQGYSASIVCSPSRGALLTGRYPARTKFTTVWNNTGIEIDTKDVLHSLAKEGEKGGRQKFNYRLDEALHYHTLPSTETTFANILSENGYETGYLGKWHCGWAENYWPDKRGFNYAEGFRKEPLRTPHFGRDAKGKLAGMEDLSPDAFVGDALTDKAVEFIKKNAKGDKPFMLMLSHYLVHGPLAAKESYIEKYENKKATDQRKPVYAAMVQSVDESVGRVMDVLQESGIDDNTVIIFTSDNGGLVPATSNYPLMGGKSYMFEAGARVPFLIRWKGKIIPKVDEIHRVMHTDLFPTMLDMAGIEKKNELHKDGTSLYPLLLNSGTWKQKPVFFHYPHYTHATSPASFITVDDWKLIRFYNDTDDKQFMLFDLKNDPYELNDLSGKNSEKLEELKIVLKKYLDETDAEQPVPNSGFDPSKPEELGRERYYNQAIREREENENALKRYNDQK